MLIQHPEREGDSLDHGFQFVLEAPELRLEGLVALLELFGGRRDGVSSAGMVVRASLWGLAVAELDVVRPLDRGRRGWGWSLSLSPGF